MVGSGGSSQHEIGKKGQEGEENPALTEAAPQKTNGAVDAALPLRRNHEETPCCS